MKKCAKCEVIKDDSCFHMQGNKLRSRCKPCRKIDKKAYREKNKEKINAQAKKYYEENREILRIKASAHHKMNKEKINKRKAEYKLKFPEKEKNKQLKYRQRIKEELTDTYIKEVIKANARNKNIKIKNIPLSLINITRDGIILKRLSYGENINDREEVLCKIKIIDSIINIKYLELEGCS